jgi:hypothetical protein
MEPLFEWLNALGVCAAPVRDAAGAVDALASGAALVAVLAAHGALLPPDAAAAAAARPAAGGGAARVHDELAAFVAVRRALQRLGVPLTAHQAAAIAARAPGAGVSLLHALRTALEAGGGLQCAGQVKHAFNGASLAVFEHALRALLGDQRTRDFARRQAAHDAAAAHVARRAAHRLAADEHAARLEATARHDATRGRLAGRRDAAAAADARSAAAWGATLRVRAAAEASRRAFRAARAARRVALRERAVADYAAQWPRAAGGSGGGGSGGSGGGATTFSTGPAAHDDASFVQRGSNGCAGGSDDPFGAAAPCSNGDVDRSGSPDPPLLPDSSAGGSPDPPPPPLQPPPPPGACGGSGARPENVLLHAVASDHHAPAADSRAAERACRRARLLARPPPCLLPGGTGVTATVDVANADELALQLADSRVWHVAEDFVCAAVAAGAERDAARAAALSAALAAQRAAFAVLVAGRDDDVERAARTFAAVLQDADAADALPAARTIAALLEELVGAVAEAADFRSCAYGAAPPPPPSGPAGWGLTVPVLSSSTALGGWPPGATPPASCASEVGAHYPPLLAPWLPAASAATVSSGNSCALAGAGEPWLLSPTLLALLAGSSSPTSAGHSLAAATAATAATTTTTSATAALLSDAQHAFEQALASATAAVGHRGLPQLLPELFAPLSDASPGSGVEAARSTKPPAAAAVKKAGPSHPPPPQQQQPACGAAWLGTPPPLPPSVADVAAGAASALDGRHRVISAALARAAASSHSSQHPIGASWAVQFGIGSDAQRAGSVLSQVAAAVAVRGDGGGCTHEGGAAPPPLCAMPPAVLVSVAGPPLLRASVEAVSSRLRAALGADCVLIELPAGASPCGLASIVADALTATRATHDGTAQGGDARSSASTGAAMVVAVLLEQHPLSEESPAPLLAGDSDALLRSLAAPPHRIAAAHVLLELVAPPELLLRKRLGWLTEATRAAVGCASPPSSSTPTGPPAPPRMWHMDWAPPPASFIGELRRAAGPCSARQPLAGAGVARLPEDGVDALACELARHELRMRPLRQRLAARHAYAAIELPRAASCTGDRAVEDAGARNNEDGQVDDEAATCRAACAAAAPLVSAACAELRDSLQRAAAAAGEAALEAAAVQSQLERAAQARSGEGVALARLLASSSLDEAPSGELTELALDSTTLFVCGPRSSAEHAAQGHCLAPTGGCELLRPPPLSLRPLTLQQQLLQQPPVVPTQPAADPLASVASGALTNAQAEAVDEKMPSSSLAHAPQLPAHHTPSDTNRSAALGGDAHARAASSACPLESMQVQWARAVAAHRREVMAALHQLRVSEAGLARGLAAMHATLREHVLLPPAPSPPGGVAAASQEMPRLLPEAFAAECASLGAMAAALTRGGGGPRAGRPADAASMPGGAGSSTTPQPPRLVVVAVAEEVAAEAQWLLRADEGLHAELVMRADEARWRLRDAVDARAAQLATGAIPALLASNGEPAAGAARALAASAIAALLRAERRRFLAARGLLTRYYALSAGADALAVLGPPSEEAAAAEAASGPPAGRSSAPTTAPAAAAGKPSPRSDSIGGAPASDPALHAALAGAPPLEDGDAASEGPEGTAEEGEGELQEAHPPSGQLDGSAASASTRGAPRLLDSALHSTPPPAPSPSPAAAPLAAASMRGITEPRQQRVPPPPAATGAPPPATTAATSAAAAAVDPAVLAAFTDCLTAALGVTAQLEAVAVRQARARAARIAGESELLTQAVAAVRADEERAAAAHRAAAQKPAAVHKPGGGGKPPVPPPRSHAAAAATAAERAAAEQQLLSRSSPRRELAAAGDSAATTEPPPPPRSVRDIAACVPLHRAHAAPPLVDEALLVATRLETARFTQCAARLLVLAAALSQRAASVVARARGGLLGAVAHTAESLRRSADALPRMVAAGRMLQLAPDAEAAALLLRPAAHVEEAAQGLVTYAATGAAAAPAPSTAAQSPP